MGRKLPEFKGLDSDLFVPFDPTTRRAFRRNLLLNCRVAESKTKRAALAYARRQRRVDRAKSLIKNLFGKIKRKLERLLEMVLID